MIVIQLRLYREMIFKNFLFQKQCFLRRLLIKLKQKCVYFASLQDVLYHVYFPENEQNIYFLYIIFMPKLTNLEYFNLSL